MSIARNKTGNIGKLKCYIPPPRIPKSTTSENSQITSQTHKNHDQNIFNPHLISKLHSVQEKLQEIVKGNGKRHNQSILQDKSDISFEIIGIDDTVFPENNCVREKQLSSERERFKKVTSKNNQKDYVLSKNKEYPDKNTKQNNELKENNKVYQQTPDISSIKAASLNNSLSYNTMKPLKEHSNNKLIKKGPLNDFQKQYSNPLSNGLIQQLQNNPSEKQEFNKFVEKLKDDASYQNTITMFTIMYYYQHKNTDSSK